jgi:hypothetical protein
MDMALLSHQHLMACRSQLTGNAILLVIIKCPLQKHLTFGKVKPGRTLIKRLSPNENLSSNPRARLNLSAKDSPFTMCNNSSTHFLPYFGRKTMKVEVYAY